MSDKFFTRPVPDRIDSRVVPFGEVELGGEFQWKGKVYIKRRTNSAGKNGAVNGSKEPSVAFHDKVDVTIMVE